MTSMAGSVMGVHLTEDEIPQILEEADHESSPFVTPQGLVAFETHALIV